MPVRQVVIRNKMGLHVRPATAFAETALKFSSSVQVTRDGDGTVADGKSPLDLLVLAATCGTALTLTAEGPDADQALEALERLIEARFGFE